MARLPAREAVETRADAPAESRADAYARKAREERAMRALLLSAPLFASARPSHHPPIACKWCGFEATGRDIGDTWRTLADHVRAKHPERLPADQGSEEWVRAMIRARTANWWG